MGILIASAMYSTPPVSDLSPAPGIKLLLLVLLLLLLLLSLLLVVVVFMLTTFRRTVMLVLLSCSVILFDGRKYSKYNYKYCNDSI